MKLKVLSFFPIIVFNGQKLIQMFLKQVISNEIDVKYNNSYNNWFDETNRCETNNKYKTSIHSNCYSYRFPSEQQKDFTSIREKCEDIKVVKVNSIQCKTSTDRTFTEPLIGSQSNCIGCELVWPIVMRIWSQCSLNLISFIGYGIRVFH